MRLTLALALLALTAAGCAEAERLARDTIGASDSNQYGSIDRGVDRPGSDYHSFDLAGADFETCQRACVDDAQCRAWTFTEPGVQSDGGMCWLKDEVPGTVDRARMVSGVVRR